MENKEKQIQLEKIISDAQTQLNRLKTPDPSNPTELATKINELHKEFWIAQSNIKKIRAKMVQLLAANVEAISSSVDRHHISRRPHKLTDDTLVSLTQWLIQAEVIGFHITLPVYNEFDETE